ncbi:MAG: hypothetical protein ACAI34_25980 [Verrucomicrobium sp.]|nr:hypothetical protein [Verrucomicrobium sp.]
MSPQRSSSLLLLAVSLLACLGFATGAEAQSKEYVIVSGGPALRKWENLRAPGTQHDRWWGNFIRPARIRIEEIQKQDPGAMITWLVYRNAFTTRSAEDNRALAPLVESVRDKYRVRLLWFDSGTQLINYLNNGQNRSQVKICNFEYFGHSNKYCFMFDYSNAVYGVSKSWLHEKDLPRIRGGIFTRDAHCKSWGCHTGESMSRAFRNATGVVMVGAIGKTDYSNPVAIEISPGGQWTNG